ncbi:polysaccharide biosynthesis protein [Metabacillus idriensis]|uniref:PssD/Cps14F family polysaccharide biosynthesis glycosyltransferase n=1 Tax=Metabacillus idriensis TaxID=324768 RepID=UPI00203F87EF|nr:PssD/Cps14F family polysaccharide biosynthesis glycosyltransferase [Metabacillus idriensis]MCM3597514.1 polysaccharide biosynthesis protein [Metabacillus idriensis]
MSKICFVSSTGGHYMQLKTLFSKFEDSEFCVVTEKSIVTNRETNLKHNIYFLKQQERKNLFFIFIFIYNIFISFYYMIKIRPKFIISTGAGAVIPFCILGKMYGCRLIYIESFAKVNSPTLTGKILYRFSDKFYVQWEDLLTYYKKAEYKGRIY